MKIDATGYLVALTLALAAVPAAAGHALQDEAVRSYSLKDGGTLHVFKDGKMALENKYGRAVSLRKGQVVETNDDRKIEVVGNEVGKLDLLLQQGHQN
ncbi:CopK family periplasmic copper-binding protein [Massilia sp. YIM B04103]|uniref:CopK family periplasmic copper-binding protein n=1 Tax=Massilia sp. YIM B04103 TaxID=2963106 RepID=UPI002108C576|nr:CopK family periplasmic copper-binding protein [Massilia sp. YIM B04103]